MLQAAEASGYAVTVDKSAVLVGALVIGSIALLTAAVLLQQFIKGFQRHPPVDQIFATKEELGDVSKDLTRIETNLGAAIARLDERFTGELAGQRSYTAKTTREIYTKLDESIARLEGKIDSQTASFGASMQALERSIGKIEGKIETLSTQK
jgi:hypothetical protein